MCELFNVAFGFALVFMKATLDTYASVVLFACVGRCFTVDVLLTPHLRGTGTLVRPWVLSQ